VATLRLRQKFKLVGARRPAFFAEPSDEWLEQKDGGIPFGKARLLCHAQQVARRRALAKENRNKKGSSFLAPFTGRRCRQAGEEQRRR
jgi:hypothetical protein